MTGIDRVLQPLVSASESPMPEGNGPDLPLPGVEARLL